MEFRQFVQRNCWCDFPHLILNGISRDRNWCFLQNRPLQYGIPSIYLTKLLMRFFTFDIEWDFPEQKLVSSSKSSSSISSSSLKVVSSSKGLPKIGAIELFGLSIGTIFNDWIFFIFFQKSHEIFAWGFSSYRLGLSVEPRHEDGVFSAGLLRPRHEVFPD